MFDARTLSSVISKALAPLTRRVSLLVSRGVVTLVNDTLKCQGLQIELMPDELHDDVEHFQEYGFTSHAKAGAEALFLSVGGMRSHGIVACVADRRFRIKTLVEGEVALYTDEGDTITLKRGKIIEISGQAKVVVKSPAVKLGDDAAVEKVVLGTTYRTQEDAMITALNTMETALTVFANGLGAALTADLGAAAPPVVYAPAAVTPLAAALAAAIAAFQAAIGTFQGGAATYLSTVTVTK